MRDRTTSLLCSVSIGRKNAQNWSKASATRGFLEGQAQYVQHKPFLKRARENSSEFKDLEDDPDADVDDLVGHYQIPKQCPNMSNMSKTKYIVYIIFYI